MSTKSPVGLSLHAMATRFELLLYGDDPVRLRAAGEEALREIERLESQLSFYRADSEIRWINNRAARQPVKVEPRLFRLLQRCAELTKLTDGAFDISVGPLMRAWKFVSDGGGVPTREELDSARKKTGMHLVEMDSDSFTVRFKDEGVEIDLGGFGKGYAVERAIDLLLENGVNCALLHGGTSSVFGIGSPLDQPSWRIALGDPFPSAGLLSVVNLIDQGLSVSALHGKFFTRDGREYGHIIDPRRGEPVSEVAAAAVTGPSPSVCEALSKALMVCGRDWLLEQRRLFPGYNSLIALRNSDGTIQSPVELSGELMDQE